MRDRVFLDTNVVAYLYSSNESGKQAIAIDAIDRFDCILSTQVLNEFCNICTRKWKLPIPDVVREIGELLQKAVLIRVDVDIIEKALLLHSKYRYTYYDSLMLAAALASSCSYILSEDMQDEQVIEDSLTIKNIFR